MLLYTVGFYAAYRYNLSAIKGEMRSTIVSVQYHPDQVFTIEIPLDNDLAIAQDFEKVDTHELSYKGEMYDIISARREKDKVVYTCINDEEESHLINVFAKQVQQQNNHPLAGKKPVSLIKFSFTDFNVSQGLIIPFILPVMSIANATVSLDELAVTYLNIPSPPPWLV